MPCRIPKIGRIEFDQGLDPSVGVAQVNRQNIFTASVVCGLWMGPRHTLVSELKAVIIEFTSEVEADRKVACLEDSDRLRAGNFVDVRHNDHVS